MLLRDEYESNGRGGVESWRGVGGGGESDRGLSCSPPSALRSLSVKRRRGETEDNFVRRNVREQ